MKTKGLAASLVLLAGAAWANYDVLDTPDKVQIHSILAYEFLFSSQARPPKDTLWGKVQADVQQIRRFQEAVEDLDEQVRAGKADRERARELAQCRARLARLETTYAKILWPGIKSLAESLRQIRLMTAEAGVIYKNREMAADLINHPEAKGLFDRAARPDAVELLGKELVTEKSGPGINPLPYLKSERENAFAYALKAEGLLEKARERLAPEEAEGSSETGSLTASLDSLQASLLELAAAGSGLATGLRELEGKEYARAIAALDQFFRDVDKGQFSGERRDKAAGSLNEATKRFSIWEYGIASDIREANILWELLDSKRALL